jgi:hypothetical protein
MKKIGRLCSWKKPKKERVLSAESFRKGSWDGCASSLQGLATFDGSKGDDYVSFSLGRMAVCLRKVEPRK